MRCSAAASVPDSEHDLPTELHLSRVVGSAAHRAKAGTEHVTVGYAKDRMVEDVERFCPELEHAFSPERKRPDDRCIETDVSLGSECISPRVAKGIKRRQREGGGIEPLGRTSVRKMGIANLVGSLPAAPDVRAIITVTCGEILAVAPGEDIVQLPVSHDVIDDLVSRAVSLPGSDRYLVQPVRREDVGHIGSRQSV